MDKAAGALQISERLRIDRQQSLGFATRIDGALTAAGFSDVRWFTPFTTDADQPPQTLLLAVRSGPEPEPVRVPVQRTDASDLIWKQMQIIEAQLNALGARGSRP